MVKRRNHEVPKGLLKNWLGFEGGSEGLHHVDLSSGDLRFEIGREARFAITDHIYVPIRADGERDDSLEDWFSIDENGLAVFSRMAATGTLASFTNEKLTNQAIRACIALGSRSAYGMFMAISAFESGAASPHEAAVDNILRSIGHKFRAFSTWRFLVVHDLPVRLLISERPFLDFTFRGEDLVLMALGPHALLIGSPSDLADESKMQLGAFRAAPGHERLARLHNHASIEMARQWVVAESRSDLEAVLGELTPEKVFARRRSDRVIVSNGNP